MEVGKHIALVDGSMSSGAQLAFNKDAWDELPLEAQQILFDATVPAMTAWAQGTVDYWKQLIAEGEEMGITFVPPTEIDQALQESREAQTEEVAASAPSSVQDPDALRADFEEVASEWDALWQEHVGIKRADKSSLETALEDFSMGSEAIDWEAYEAAMTELLQPIRP
jgi:TRAP-type mannitol/chloroaromatic compound transport system substrate-binding protein